MRVSATKLAAVGVIATVVLGCAVPAAALSVGSAALPAGGNSLFFHPGLWSSPLPRFTAFAGNLTPDEGFSPHHAISSPFSDPNSGHDGVFHSEAWQHQGDGHLLFLYRIDLHPNSVHVSKGSVFGYGNWDVIDSGVLGETAYAHGEIAALRRFATSPSQLNFYYTYAGQGDLLGPGEDSSAWFYFETEATKYDDTGWATLIDGGVAVTALPVLVPLDPSKLIIPEPITLLSAVLGVGAAGTYLRRRFRAAQKLTCGRCADPERN